MLSGKSTKHACVHAGVSLCYLLLRKRIDCFVYRPGFFKGFLFRTNARTSTPPTR